MQTRKIAIAQSADIKDRIKRVFGLTSRPMSSPRPPTNKAIQLSNSGTVYAATLDGNIAVHAIKPKNIEIPPIRGIGVR
jgi:hypothetical protein